MTEDSDYYLEIARHRLNEIEAERAPALAAIASAKAAGDYESGADAVQCVANLDTEKQNTRATYARPRRAYCSRLEFF